MRLRTTMALVASVMTLAVLGTAPAQAADAAHRLSGPGTGDPDVFLTYVGCDALFGAAQPPQSRLNLGPYTSPMGRRSLGLVPPATGTASGPFTRFDSLAGLDATVAVASRSGSSGVSYVMAITPDNVPGTAWRGRAPLSAPGGAWTTVSTAATTYQWALVDLATLAPLGSSETGTPADLAASHGDGAGFAVTGFGCDGSSFNLDAVRGAGRTFDWEGAILATDMAVDRAWVEAGQSVSLTGRVTDPGGRVTGDALVLESRRPGGAWAPVGDVVISGPGGLSRVDVPVSETTEFRWHRPESQYADEGWSDPVTVTVTQPAAPSEGDSKK